MFTGDVLSPKLAYPAAPPPCWRVIYPGSALIRRTFQAGQGRGRELFTLQHKGVLFVVLFPPANPGIFKKWHRQPTLGTS
jgi:hypothetical protein